MASRVKFVSTTYQATIIQDLKGGEEIDNSYQKRQFFVKVGDFGFLEAAGRE